MHIYHNPKGNILFEHACLSLHQILNNMRTFGELKLNIMVSSCLVRSMLEVRNMPFKDEACHNKDCPKRLSFSLESLQDLPSSSWELECVVKFCMKGPDMKVCGALFCTQCKSKTLYKAQIIQPSLVVFFCDFSVQVKQRKPRRTCRSSHIYQPLYQVSKTSNFISNISEVQKEKSN